MLVIVSDWHSYNLTYQSEQCLNMLVDISTLLRLRSSSRSLKAPIPGSMKETSAGIKQQLPQVGTGAAKITNKKYPRAGTQIFFEKIACAETAELRMTVPYTTEILKWKDTLGGVLVYNGATEE